MIRTVLHLVVVLGCIRTHLAQGADPVEQGESGATLVTLNAEHAAFANVIAELGTAPESPGFAPQDPQWIAAARTVTLRAVDRPWLEVASEVVRQAGFLLDWDEQTGLFRLSSGKELDWRAPHAFAGGMMLYCDRMTNDAKLDYGPGAKAKTSVTYEFRLLAEPRAAAVAVLPEPFTASVATDPNDTAQPVGDPKLGLGLGVSRWTVTQAYEGPVRHFPRQLDLTVNVLYATQESELVVEDVLAEGSSTKTDWGTVTITRVKPMGTDGFQVTAVAKMALPASVLATLPRASPRFLPIVEDDTRTRLANVSARVKNDEVTFNILVTVPQTDPKPKLRLRWRLPTEVKRQEIRLTVPGGEK